MGYTRFRSNGPKFGPAFLGFVTVLGVTGIALIATSGESYRPYAQLRSVPTSLLMPSAEPEVASVTPDATGNSKLTPAGDPNSVDAVATSATTDDAVAPLCDVTACSKAYKSFRAADCTFQPFEGARRLCKR